MEQECRKGIPPRASIYQFGSLELHLLRVYVECLRPHQQQFLPTYSG